MRDKEKDKAVEEKLLLEACEILAKLGFGDGAIPEKDGLQHLLRRIDLLGYPDDLLVECGSCGSYHPHWFKGDCRDDAHRFASYDGDRE